MRFLHGCRMKNLSEAIEKVMALDPEHRKTVPLRLEVAAQVAFPYNGMTASGLRKERDRGPLVTEMIAGKEYTTLADIDRMRELCRSRRQVPTDDFEARAKAAQNAAFVTAAVLKERSSKKK